MKENRNTYLRKNNEPSGKITLRSSGTSGTLLWNQIISGGGRPVALQFNVNGSSLAATASVGCSVIRGRCCATKNGDKKVANQKKFDNFSYIYIMYICFFYLSCLVSLCHTRIQIESWDGPNITHSTLHLEREVGIMLCK